MTEAMAVTHAITWLKEEKLDKTEMILVGDPLDVEMFQCTEWILDEENTTEFIAQRMYPKDASSEYRISPYCVDSTSHRNSCVPVQL